MGEEVRGGIRFECVRLLDFTAPTGHMHFGLSELDGRKFGGGFSAHGTTKEFHRRMV